MTRPTVISVASGPNQQPLIRAAQAAGYAVWAIDREPRPDLVDRAIAVSTYDADAVVGAVRNALTPEVQLCGILARTSGLPLATAARLAKSFDLPGIPPMAAAAAIDKSVLAAQAEAAGVATPKSVRLSSRTLEKAALPPAPWIVKPDRPIEGKRHIVLIESFNKLTQYIDNYDIIALEVGLLCQSFCPGDDLGLMLVVQDSKVIWSTVYDEFVSIEAGQIRGRGVSAPSALAGTRIDARAHAAAQRLLSRWGVSRGIYFFTFRAENADAHPILYETNPGLCGDGLADRLLPAVFDGADFFALDVALMTGGRPTLPGQPQRSARIIDGRLEIEKQQAVHG